MELEPITLENANSFVFKYHRHHGPVVGHKFSIAVSENNKIIGVVIVGRPVSRMMNDGYTLEVTRCCTDGKHNACSMLYGAAWRACRAMGYKRLITYILASESGSSLKASGYKLIAKVKGYSWNRKDRPRIDKHPTIDKLKYEIAL